MHPLIAAEELHDNLSNVLVFDCRAALGDTAKGRQDFEAGHIQGAVHADLDVDLSSAPGDGGRHPLPDRGAITSRFCDWGIQQGSRLVCYDQNNGAFAGRFWWLARWLGHEHVQVLDGGLDEWLASGFSTETIETPRTKSDFQAAEPLTRVCSASDLTQESHLIDARDEARFRGEHEPIDPVAGHIPGAVCAPFSANLDNGKFRSPEALTERFKTLGFDQHHNIVCYCGSGVSAIHNILALLIAGYPEPVLYPGSWSEWIRDPQRPIATGE